jgi:hypothetical protein
MTDGMVILVVDIHLPTAKLTLLHDTNCFIIEIYCEWVCSRERIAKGTGG